MSADFSADFVSAAPTGSDLVPVASTIGFTSLSPGSAEISVVLLESGEDPFDLLAATRRARVLLRGDEVALIRVLL